MQRQTTDRLTGRRDASGAIDGPRRTSSEGDEGIRRRSFKPGERSRIAAPRQQCRARSPRDRCARCPARGGAADDRGVPEPHRPPAEDAAGAAGALIGRVLRDAFGSRLSIARSASYRATFCSPVSTTSRTSGTVSVVSAMFVARITRGRVCRGERASCSSASRPPCSGRTSTPDDPTTGATAVGARRISGAPGRKHSRRPGRRRPQIE